MSRAVAQQREPAGAGRAVARQREPAGAGRVVPQQRRSVETRRALLDAARAAFAERGFADASMEEIAETAGVSRGPLYHYFADKQDLFRAVYEEVEAELIAEVDAGIRVAYSPGASIWEQVQAGAAAYLDACSGRAVQRIVLLEAPVVLGFGTGREVSRHGLDLLRRGLAAAMDEGVIAREPIEPLAQMLRAALTSGAMMIARGRDKRAARAEVGAAARRLLDGLRIRQ